MTIAPPPRTYTTNEAAEALGVHPQTLRRWERRKTVPPPRRRGRVRFYTEADIRAIERAVTSGSGAAAALGVVGAPSPIGG